MTRATWKIKDDSDTRHVELRMRMTRATLKFKDDKDTRQVEFKIKVTRASWNDVFGQVQ